MKPHTNTSSFSIIILLTMIQFTNFLDANMIMPLGSKLTSELGISEKVFGLLVASYSCAAFVSGLLAMKWIDKYNRRRLFLSLYAGFIVGSGLCVIPTKEVSLLIIARIIAGSFGGVLTSCTLTYIGDIIPQNNRGSALGLVMIAGPLSLVLGIPAGLWFSNIASWHWIFVLVTGVSIICWIMAYFYLPKTASVAKTTNNMGKIIKLLKESKVQKLLALMVTQALGPNLVLPFLSSHLVNKIGVSENQLPIVYLVASLITLVISPLAGKMSDIFGAKKTYGIWLVLSTLALYLLTLLSNSSLFVVCCLSSLFMCFNQGRRTIAVAVTLGEISSAQRGCFMSLTSSIQSLVLASASILGGLILNTNSQGEFTNFSTLGAYAAGVLLLSMIPIIGLNFKKGQLPNLVKLPFFFQKAVNFKGLVYKGYLIFKNRSERGSSLFT